MDVLEPIFRVVFTLLSWWTLWCYWQRPKNCKRTGQDHDEFGELSLPRYFFGAIIPTGGCIALWTYTLIGAGVFVLSVFLGFYIQNRYVPTDTGD